MKETSLYSQKLAQEAFQFAGYADLEVTYVALFEKMQKTLKKHGVSGHDLDDAMDIVTHINHNAFIQGFKSAHAAELMKC